MRLEAQMKKGFYPLPELVAGMIGDKLVGGAGSTIFDPCAGEGSAVKVIAERAGVPAQNIFASELDIDRSDSLRRALPDSAVYGPLDFLAAFHYGTVSCAYVNPPYDNELGGGGRIEWKFIERAVNCVAPHGLIVAVVPERVASNTQFGSIATSMLYDLQAFTLPEECREYGEVVVFGRVLEKRMRPSWWSLRDITRDYADISPVNLINGGRVVVRKVSYTEQELAIELEKCDSQQLLSTNAKRKTRVVRPPMELRKGHQAMLLASGFLDGVVDNGVESPHVVRGSAVKRVDKKEERIEGGGIKVTETERIYLVVKVATADGRVLTLTDQVDLDGGEESESELEESMV
jgi:hypothetical protein